MVAVGMWGAQLGAPAIWLLPVTFPIVMAFGGMLGLLGVKLWGIETGIALSAIALGLAVLCEARPKLWIAAVIVGFFATFMVMRTERSCHPAEMACSLALVLSLSLGHCTWSASELGRFIVGRPGGSCYASQVPS
jgi:urease accessory protein